ncbi:LOW QUALITY PROTEIN: uncharacterized protein C1orf87 homolog [Erethizon dorsatum]
MKPTGQVNTRSEGNLRRIISAVWKMPRGSDAKPEIKVKIIGSKHFRYLMEKTKNWQEENPQANTPAALKKPMTSTAGQVRRDPPAPPETSALHTNYLPSDGEQQGSKHTDATQQPENTQQLPAGALSSTYVHGRTSDQANVYFSSVPTGHQSLSYVHGLPRRRLGGWSMEQRADVTKKASGMTREDVFLLTLVRRELKLYPLSSSLLDQLQGDLNPISSGFLLTSQLSHLLLRHEILLQLPTVQLLCDRFSSIGSPEMGPLRRDARQQRHKGAATVKDCAGWQAPPQPSDADQSLLEILKMVLWTSNGQLNIEKLNLNFWREDCSFSGCLPTPKVRAICGKYGLYLTFNVLEVLLNHQNLGYKDEIKWQNFVELLSRGSDLLSGLPTGKNEKEAPASPGEPEVPEVSSQTEPVVHAEHRRVPPGLDVSFPAGWWKPPSCPASEILVLFWWKTPEESLKPENPPDKTSALEDPLNPLKIRPFSQPFVSSAMKNGSEEHEEAWIDRFRKLENTLYFCDLSNTGNLEKEARCLIYNYNLIHNLSLSPQKIDQSLRFCSGDNLLREPALQCLKELCYQPLWKGGWRGSLGKHEVGAVKLNHGVLSSHDFTLPLLNSHVQHPVQLLVLGLSATKFHRGR